MDSEFVKGHRSRLKEKYKSGGFSHDYELLELLLTYSIPRRDVKPAAKSLLARFGSVEGVLNANSEQLKEIAGIGENSALIISAISEINKRAFEQGDCGCRIVSREEITAYCRAALANYGANTILMITLNNSGGVISCNDGTEDCRLYDENGNVKQFGSILLRDSAARVVFAQKTDSELPRPAMHTVSFVIKMISFFSEIEAELADYIIIGNNGTAYSMRGSERYNHYF